MINTVTHQALLLSLQRALLGEIHPQLRQASIQADGAEQVVRIRFEYDGHPSSTVRDSYLRVATKVIADFPSSWGLDAQHVSIPAPHALSPLVHVAYLRAETQREA